MRAEDDIETARDLLPAEKHVPELLYDMLRDLETTRHSDDVWTRLVRLGRTVALPYVDLVSTSGYRDWRRSLFVRTSYDSSWLQAHAGKPEVERWSYYRSHAMHHLTPILTGLEFVNEYHDVTPARIDLLKEAARRGLRSGFSIPLRVATPPQAALITFSGDHARRDMLAILRAHGWTLQVAALVAHQRYLYHFAREFRERNQITRKQVELLELIGAGLQDKAIADRLDISVSAVRQRLASLQQNTGLESRTELAALAMSMGVLPDPLLRTRNQPREVVVEMDHSGTRVRPES